MFCAISGKIPKKAVLSPKSNCIFEKSLIETYIADEGKDPINNKPLSIKELVEISMTPQQAALTNSVNSSTLNANYSIPNLLSTLQNEYDAIMLENFKLRKQLDIFSKQLSIALYERDAAKSVSVKLLEENDHLKIEINKITNAIGNTDIPMDTEEDNIVEQKTNDIAYVSDTTRQELIKASKEYTKISKSDKPREHTGKLAYNGTPSFISDKVSIAQHYNNMTGLEKTVYNISYDEAGCINIEQFRNNDKKHFKIEDTTTMINCPVDYIRSAIMDNNSNLLIIASRNKENSDKSNIFMYDITNKTTKKISERSIENKIIYMYQHPKLCSNCIFFVTEDGLIGIIDMSTKEVKYFNSKNDRKENEIFTKARMHKDGLLVGLLQNDNNISIFNISGNKDEIPTRLKLGKEIPISESMNKIEENIEDFFFSTNGYWLVVKTNKQVLTFDLRKDVGTLAFSPYDISEYSSCVTMDVTGKLLLLYNKDSSRLVSLVYQKNKKGWVEKDSVEIGIDSDVKEIKMLNPTEKGLTILFYLKKGYLVVNSSNII